MNKTRYGMWAGIAGAAMAAAWWWRQRGGHSEFSDHGEVIFSNSPRVSEID
jgi:hypothetical protein